MSQVGTRDSVELPAFPKVLDGLTAFFDPSVCIVVGSSRPLVVRGVDASRVLPALLKACDGTRTLAGLGDELELSLEETTEVVELLWKAGLVESGGEGGNAVATSAERYLADACAGANSFSSGRAAVHALGQCPIEILGGRSEFCSTLESVLRGSGLRIASGSDGSPRQPALVTLLLLEAEASRSGRLEPPQCKSARAPIIPVVFDAERSRVFVGPFLDADAPPTLSVVENELDALIRAVDEDNDSEADAQTRWTSNRAYAAAASLVANHIVSYFCGQSSAYSLKLLYEHDLRRWVTIGHVVSGPFVSDSGLVHGERDDFHPALAYEQSTEVRTSRLVQQRVAISRPPLFAPSAPQPRAYPTKPRIRLDQPLPGSRSPSIETTSGRISFLLQMVAGLRPPDDAANSGEQRDAEDARRWVPSGGNLGSNALCLTATENMTRHAFYYDPAGHELVHLSSRSTTDFSHTALPHLPDDMWRAWTPEWLVFVGDIQRLRTKYGSFSYKLAHLDAGCAMTQAILVLASMGVAPYAETVGDCGVAELAATLELISSQESVSGLIGISGLSTPHESQAMTESRRSAK